jgi:hypothetical protein
VIYADAPNDNMYICSPYEIPAVTYPKNPNDLIAKHNATERITNEGNNNRRDDEDDKDSLYEVWEEFNYEEMATNDGMNNDQLDGIADDDDLFDIDDEMKNTRMNSNPSSQKKDAPLFDDDVLRKPDRDDVLKNISSVWVDNVYNIRWNSVLLLDYSNIANKIYFFGLRTPLKYLFLPFVKPEIKSRPKVDPLNLDPNYDPKGPIYLGIRSKTSIELLCQRDEQNIGFEMRKPFRKRDPSLENPLKKRLKGMNKNS